MVNKRRQFTLGVLVNPFAGIGGALALKGSDGKQIREKALREGAQLQANNKMRRALKEIAINNNTDLKYVTAADNMGANLLSELGANYKVVYAPERQQTEAFDTEQALRAMLDAGIDFLLFAGGDGTARNVANVIGQQIPVLGVPAGCKIHSGVYAVTPSAAGKVAQKVITGELVSQVNGEVRDIDETAFRNGKVIAKHYGEMRIPQDLSYVQSVKMGGQESDELVLQDIVEHVAEAIEEHPDYFFIMGSGSTVNTVMQHMGLENTLLGVDIVYQNTVYAKDVSASDLEELVAEYASKIKLVITVIGGQGHVFGRGNQQLSATFLKHIKKQDIYILASKLKLNSLQGRPLRIDSGDEQIDKKFHGPTTVITGFHDKALYPME